MTITPTHPLPGLPRQLPRLADLRADVAAELRGDLDAVTSPSLTPARRGRHEVRDGVAVIAFSAAASTRVALMLLLFRRVGGLGAGGDDAPDDRGHVPLLSERVGDRRGRALRQP